MLPPTGDPASLPSLLAVSHTIRVWYSDPAHFRLAVPQSMSESDVIRNGSSAWLWDSSTNTVTHVSLPSGAPLSEVPSTPLMLQRAADQVLARIGPTTAVSADSNVTVAGAAAYQLVLAPRSPRSLVSQVRIAIDARHNVPLRVQVFAKHETSPAIQVGFASVSFVRRAVADFAFTPPAGGEGHRGKCGDQKPGPPSRPRLRARGNGTAGVSVIGQGWLAVAAVPQSSLPSLTGTASPGGSGGPGLGPFRSPSANRLPPRPALLGGTGTRLLRRHRRDPRCRPAVWPPSQRPVG